MAESYKVELISQERKNQEMEKLYSPGLLEMKADIHGTCVKFFTDNRVFRTMWAESFRPMPDDIRPHCRMFAVSGRECGYGKKMRVLYEPVSKTAIVLNCDYYGWIKSIALALVADFMEDFTSEHRRYSVHGSFVDFGGKGVAIIGPPGSGKTTLTYGLLLGKRANFLTDDWFFVRLVDGRAQIFSSEQNSYVRDDIAHNWPGLSKKLCGMKKDNYGRSVVDVKRLFGAGKIKESSELAAVVLLERKKGDAVFRKLPAKNALAFMVANDFCNPHQLMRTKRKLEERKRFFAELFSRAPVYLLNTIETPQKSLGRLKKIL